MQNKRSKRRKEKLELSDLLCLESLSVDRLPSLRAFLILFSLLIIMGVLLYES